MDIEIPDINTQYYIKARMSVINNRRSNRFTTNDMSEHFKKLLQLMVENKRMFSVSEVENYVQDMNTFTFPI
jgi:F0F1-type ATP synthase delta subunit